MRKVYLQTHKYAGVTRLEVVLIIIVILLSIITGYSWLTIGEISRTTPSSPQIPIYIPRNITIVDSAGRYVTVPWPLERVVALTTDVAEVMIALKAEDLIVGVTEYITGKPELSKVANKTLVGTCFKPNIEAIISVNPQVVITYVRWPKPEVLEEKLEPLGIKVIRLDLYKIESLFSEIKLLGLLLNRTEEAEKIVEFWQTPLELISKYVNGLKPEQKVRVYFEGYKDYHAAGPGSGYDQDLKIAGGINIFADSPIPYPKVSPEAVIERNPDVIIKAVSTRVFMPYGATETSPLEEIRNSILSRPGWEAIKAVKEGRVYLISGTLTSGPRAVIGICYIAKWLYPDAFKDLDPISLHRQYLEQFLGVEYLGIWVYP